jgi:hypothetical protein
MNIHKFIIYFYIIFCNIGGITIVVTTMTILVINGIYKVVFWNIESCRYKCSSKCHVLTL